MYITTADVLLRYPLLKTMVDNGTILADDLIKYSEYQLNSMLASAYSVPFSGAHPTIKDISIDLCYLRAMIVKDPDKAKKIKEYVYGRIEALKKGEEEIYTDSGTTLDRVSAGAYEIWSTIEDYHPTFSMLDADNQYSDISSERLIDEEAERS